MSCIITITSQKGGVGKSQFARLFALIVAQNGMTVKIADLDTQQSTSVEWANRRAENKIKPAIRVEAFANIQSAIDEAPNFDIYILDGAPHSSIQTKKAASVANLVLIPTRERMDDLLPSVVLANNLRKEGIDPKKIAFVFSMTGKSKKELQEAREYLEQTPYRVLSEEIPAKDAYGIALDQGKAIIETSFPTLRKKADDVSQLIINLITELMKQGENDNG